MGRPDYDRIHELEFELGFRDDPPVADLRFGPGVAIPSPYAWSVEQKVAYWQRALDPPPVRHIPGRGHTNLFRNVTDG